MNKADGEPFTRRDECLQNLGYAVIWMTYFHPDLFLDPDPKYRQAMEQQRDRVALLVEEYRVSNSKYKETDLYWEEFYTRIIDEIENMS